MFGSVLCMGDLRSSDRYIDGNIVNISSGQARIAMQGLVSMPEQREHLSQLRLSLRPTWDRIPSP